MSYRLPRKTRPQADVEIYGGPLKQRRFDGGMNIDSPASEIRENEVAYASNVIFREFGIEAKPGSIQISQFGFADITTSNDFAAYCAKTIRLGSWGTAGCHHALVYDETVRFYSENPVTGTFVAPQEYDDDGLSGVAYNPGLGDTHMIPYRRGFLIFNAAKISYAERSGAFQVNAPNPVHGVSNDYTLGTFKYRYLVTLSRIATYGTDNTIASADIANRLVSGAELVHESGANGARYAAFGTGVSTARETDYGEVQTGDAISAGDPYLISDEDLLAAFSTATGTTNDAAAKHFTHVSIYRTRDFGDAGLALGNSSAVYYWVADVRRDDLASGYSDTATDDEIQNRGFILKTQGFTPVPAGSCGELAGGWMFVADRSNVTADSYLNYCAVANSPENIGYHFRDIQRHRFDQGIRAMLASQDILSIFCESSSHICNLTSYVSDVSKLQSIPFLNYFFQVDGKVGIKDWATLDAIDKNTFIAVCSDNSVRKWDTTRWGDDLAYEKVSSEIQQIVPASTITYERGSVGKYYNGAYYLWYSKDTADTATTKCLRYGFGKKAGYGWSFYEGTAFPNFKRGVSVSENSQGVHRLVVIAASNGKFYWVDTFKPFVGAVDYDAFGSGTNYQMDRVDQDLATYANPGSANEIASVVRFRELIGASESDVLVHEETFHRWRPRVEASGYRAGMQVSMSAWKDGGATAFEIVTNQPRTAAIKFTKEVAARRVQLGIATTVGAWRYVGIDSRFRSLDKINFAVAGDNSSSESTISYPQFQAEWASNLDLWLTRRDNALDRATGVYMTEAVANTVVRVAGPDGKDYSGYYFPSASLSINAANAYAGDFTVSLWFKGFDVDVDMIRVAGATPFYLQLDSATQLDVSGIGTATLTAVGTGWNHLFVRRSGTSITVYQNGVLKATISDLGPTSFGGGDVTAGPGSGNGYLADVRVFGDDVSVDAMTYYYNNVINEAGDMVMPEV